MDYYQRHLIQRRREGKYLSPMERYCLYKDLEPYDSYLLQKQDIMAEIANRDKIIIDKKEFDALVKKAAEEIVNDVSKAINSIDIG